MPLRGPVGPRRRPPLVSWRLIAIGIAILVAAFALGYFAGDSGDEPQQTAAVEDQSGGGRCRKASTLATEVIELQRQALTNRTEFTQAALTGDEQRMATLNQELEPLSAQIQEAQTQMNEALEKCRRRGGGKGKGGKGEGDGGGG
ncbi:MAG: hypothetical protein M3135_05475 [Actinomycetota bacterium]|nr:hypothetical protein [Actinomycetota bacterium]